MIRVAINGFGRIGRCIARSIFENYAKNIELVAINDLGSIDSAAHLLKYDSTFGKLDKTVTIANRSLVIDKKEVFYSSVTENFPWSAHNIDIVLECSGKFTTKALASLHLTCGAKKVILSAPAKDKIDGTFVFGVNHKAIQKGFKIISNASCTTNCLAPLAKIIDLAYKIESGFINTIHAVTNDQVTLDGSHSDLRRARTAFTSIIPTTTGAASMIGEILPNLQGKLDGIAVRVPVQNVSLLDLSVVIEKKVTRDDVNELLLLQVEKNYKSTCSASNLPLVSVDFIKSEYSSNFDLSFTLVNGRLLKLLSWYDNEYAFSLRMLDLAEHFYAVS